METRLHVVEGVGGSLCVASLDGQCIIAPFNDDDSTQLFTLTPGGLLQSSHMVLSLGSAEPGVPLSTTPFGKTVLVIDEAGFISTENKELVLGSGIIAAEADSDVSIPPMIMEIVNTTETDMYIMHEVAVGAAADILVEADSDVSIFDDNKELVQKFDKLDASTTWFVDTKYSVKFTNECGKPIQIYGVNQPIALPVPDIPSKGTQDFKAREGSVYEAYIEKDAMLFVTPNSTNVAFRATITRDSEFIIREPPRVTLQNTANVEAIVKSSTSFAPEVIIPANEKREFSVSPNTQLTVRSISKHKLAFTKRGQTLIPGAVTIEKNEEYDIVVDPAEELARLLRESKRRQDLLDARNAAKLALVPEQLAFNIGGKNFVTSKASALSQKGSIFESMFATGRWKPDSNGRYFVDRDPAAFPVILNYLRTGKVNIKQAPDIAVEEVKEEMKFYFLTVPDVPAQ